MRACLHADMPMAAQHSVRVGLSQGSPRTYSLEAREGLSDSPGADMRAGDEAVLLHRRMLSRQPSAARWKPSLICSEATCATGTAPMHSVGCVALAEPGAASCCTLWCPVASSVGSSVAQTVGAQLHAQTEAQRKREAEERLKLESANADLRKVRFRSYAG